MTRAFAIALIAAVIGLATGAEQEASPSPTVERIPPTQCTTEPMTPELFAAILSTPLPEDESIMTDRVLVAGEDLHIDSEAEFPAGTPLDEATTEVLSAQVRHYLACVNAGDFLRLMALESDDYLRRTEVGSGSSSAAVAEAMAEGAVIMKDLAATGATPFPEANRLALAKLRDARMIPDGRAGIVAEITNVAGEHRATAFFLFVETDRGWLIDVILGVAAGR